jgi:hypothetical protein
MDNHFFYCPDQIWVHILVSQIPTGGFKDTNWGSTNLGREYTNAIHFCSMFYICIMDKKNGQEEPLAIYSWFKGALSIV